MEVTLAVAKVLVNSARRNFHSRVRPRIVHRIAHHVYMCSHAVLAQQPMEQWLGSHLRQQTASTLEHHTVPQWNAG